MAHVLARTQLPVLSPEALEALRLLLHSKNSEVASYAAETLGRTSQVLPDNILEALRLILQSKDSDTRSYATKALCRQSLGVEMCKDLALLFKDNDPRVRVSAAEILST